MKDDLTSLLPLSPATLHILLSLAAEERHGYGIMQEVARQSQGRYKLGPGTLYDNLQRLLDQGIVDEVALAPQRLLTKGDERRRYYKLTSLGRRTLGAEVERLEQIVREAKAYLRPARSTGGL
jgi:DNA-binding PadR family transcriptional regulator